LIFQGEYKKDWASIYHVSFGKLMATNANREYDERSWRAWGRSFRHKKQVFIQKMAM
jgi:hypothetical protein